jgi:hypothetical protein
VDDVDRHGERETVDDAGTIAAGEHVGLADVAEDLARVLVELALFCAPARG